MNVFHLRFSLVASVKVPPGIAYANMLVTTQWPLKRAAPHHLTCLGCVLWLPWKLDGAICAMSRLTSSAWDIKTKERHWWRHNGDSDRRPLSLPLRYDLVTLCLYDDLGKINVIAGILKLRKRFRMSQILFEHGINSLPLVCFRGYGNLSTLSIAIPRLAFGRAWYCDAACG